MFIAISWALFSSCQTFCPKQRRQNALQRTETKILRDVIEFLILLLYQGSLMFIHYHIMGPFFVMPDILSLTEKTECTAEDGNKNLIDFLILLPYQGPLSNL
jgi:hypothetical protein